MAKLFIDGVCVMHDTKENVINAVMMMPAGINLETKEED